MPKWLQTAMGICSLTAAIFGAIIYFASAEDLKRVEKQTVQTFDQLSKSLDLKFNQQQLTLLNDRKYRIREELRRNPKDPLVKEDYNQIREQIVIIEKQLVEKK
jgi:biopolymer transport protein ExbB/TolQ